MESNELSVIQKCQRGDLKNFVTLYDSYFQKIYNFIFYRVQHQSTAEDLTSQTFIKALEKIGSYQPEKASFSTWLYRIARNTLYDHFRTDKRNVDIEEVWGLADKSSIENDTDVKEKLSEVWSYLQQLDERHREIILLRVWDGLSYKEISQIVGKSEAACKMSFSRSLSKLNQAIPGALIYIFFFVQ